MSNLSSRRTLVGTNYFCKSIIPFALQGQLLHVGLAIILSVAATAFTLSSIEVTRRLLAAVQLSVGNVEIAQKILSSHQPISVTELIFLALGLPMFAWICAFLRDYLFDRVSLCVIRKTRELLFNHIIRLPYLSLIEIRPGVVGKRIMDDTSQIHSFLTDVTFKRIGDLLTAFGLLFYISLLDLNCTFVLLISLVIYFIVAVWSASLARRRLQIQDLHREAAVNVAVEALVRCTDIKCCAKENYEAKKFSKFAMEIEKASIHSSCWISFDQSLTGFIRSAIPIFVLLFGGWSTLHGGIPFSDVLIIIACTSILFGPVDSLSMIPLKLSAVEIAMLNVRSILILPVEKEIRQTLDRPLFENLAAVRIQGLRFSYPNSTSTLIINDLILPYGSKTGIVGASGLGKSTILRLVYGLLPSFSGTICVLGQDLEAATLLQVRNLIAFMPQEAQLFTGTVRENIVYGLDEGTVTDKEIWQCLERARIADEVNRLSKKLDASIGISGQKFSLGQRKRLCLARTLIRRAPIILLDEPTSGISPDERKKIHISISEISQSTSLILTTHDETLLQYMDNIIELDRENTSDLAFQVRATCSSSSATRRSSFK